MGNNLEFQNLRSHCVRPSCSVHSVTPLSWLRRHWNSSLAVRSLEEVTLWGRSHPFSVVILNSLNRPASYEMLKSHKLGDEGVHSTTHIYRMSDLACSLGFCFPNGHLFGARFNTRLLVEGRAIPSSCLSWSLCSARKTWFRQQEAEDLNIQSRHQ